MKKYLIALFSIIVLGAVIAVPFIGNANATYAERYQACEDAMAKKLQKLDYHTTVGRAEANAELTECFHDLITDMLREYYASRADKTVAQFEKFFDIAGKMTSNAEYPDCCAPYCGTIAGSNAYDAMHDMLRVYIKQLIRANNADEEYDPTQCDFGDNDE